MLFKLLILFIVVPFVELTLLLQLAQYTSPGFTLLTVIVTGVAGTALARSQGWETMREIERDLEQGRLPAKGLLDGVLIFCAGALLLTPGLLTDALGLSILIPFFRNKYREALVRWTRKRFRFEGPVPPDPETPGRSRIIDVRVVDRRENAESNRGEDDDAS